MLEFIDFCEYKRWITIQFQEVFMSTAFERDQAHKLVDKMPDNATWDDLIYEIYVRQVIESGLADSDAGRTIEVGDLLDDRLAVYTSVEDS